MNLDSPRRPRRIAADEAHAWARNLKLGNPYAKLVLSMLTIYVNGEGSAFVSIGQLAEDCELATETVRRRLAWLEGVGALARVPQWLDEHGRRNSDGRGKRTTDDIKLMIATDAEDIEARAFGKAENSGVDSTIEPPEFSPLPQGGAKSVSPPVSPLAAPPLRRGAESSEPEPEVPPQPPQGGAFNEASEKRWQEFKSNYPDGIVDPDAARREFAALPEPDQVACIAGVAAYAARCRKRKEKSLKAHLFVRKRSWEGLLATPTDTAAPQLYEAGSAPARALRTLAALARYTPLIMADGRLSHRGKITPRLLAMAHDDADEGLATYKMGTPNFRAWWDFIREVFEGCNLPARMELKVPWPWPPSVTGAIYSGSDPPEVVGGTLATEDDLAEMAKG